MQNSMAEVKQKNNLKDKQWNNMQKNKENNKQSTGSKRKSIYLAEYCWKIETEDQEERQKKIK